ncbi:MAG TPA: hypothetical protein GXZ90_07810 [Clostridiales bacterium]|nr:hypothetical protein [Clostridiales bacterium]
MDALLFEQACEKTINNNIEPSTIGTLSEKTIHSVLKNYYSPDISNQEIRVDNYIADIMKGDHIIEIQTGNFNKLRKKLEVYLVNYKVTIVYPVSRTKLIHWINPDTGEIHKPRKSTKTGSYYEIFKELYKIKPFLLNENISFNILLLNVDEYRYLDGWSKDKKKGASKCDKIPTKLVEDIAINSIIDYGNLIPDGLNKEFTSRHFAKAAKIPIKLSQITLNILFFVGAVIRSDKDGNSYLYQRNF